MVKNAMKTIKNVNPFSIAKISGLITGSMGLIFGFFFTFFSLFGMILSRDGFMARSMIFGMGAVIFIPVLYGILGFLVGLLMGALYNILAKWVGGIEIELG